MKLIKIFNIAVPMLLAASCSPTYEVKDTDAYSGVYMLASKNVYEKTLDLKGLPDTIRFGATYGGYNPPVEDILVNFEVAKDLVGPFNTEHGTAYEMLPESSYALEPSAVTISKGGSASNMIEMIIRSDEMKQGGNYLLPISIASVSGNIKIKEEMKTSYFAFHFPKDMSKGKKDEETKVVDMAPLSIGGYTYYLMDRNLGATTDDATDRASKGDLFQWGRDADGHQKLISDPSNTSPQFAATSNTIPAFAEYSSGEEADYRGHFVVNSSGTRDWIADNGDANNYKLWQEDGEMNNPCPEGYRLPTKDEWTAILNFPQDSDTPEKVTMKKSEDLGKVEPDVIISKYHKAGDPAGQMTYYDNIKIRCIDDARFWVLEVKNGDNVIKLPSRGTRWETGAYRYDNIGYYWTSITAPMDNSKGYLRAYAIIFNYNTSISVSINTRANGNAVRCVRVVKNE